MQNSSSCINEHSCDPHLFSQNIAWRYFKLKIYSVSTNANWYLSIIKKVVCENVDKSLYFVCKKWDWYGWKIFANVILSTHYLIVLLKWIRVVCNFFCSFLYILRFWNWENNLTIYNSWSLIGNYANGTIIRCRCDFIHLKIRTLNLFLFILMNKF